MTARETRNYKLDSKQVLPYFLDHIKSGKILSKKIVEKLDFAKGSFFTILPINVKLEALYEFKQGGIIPPSPFGEKSYPIKGRLEEFHPTQVLTMDFECSELITDFLKESDENLAVVENYMLNPDSPYVEIRNVKMAPFNVDVYYILNSKNSVEEVCETIKKCGEIWHFSTVLTRLEGGSPSILTDQVLNHICDNVKCVIAGAYDGEGYIVWKAYDDMSGQEVSLAGSV
jgi:hypothetical protein